MSLRISISVTFLLAGSLVCFSQSPSTLPPAPTPTPIKLSQQLEQSLDYAARLPAAPAEQRQQAYAKLLEGQRYIWSIFRTRTGRQNNARLASQALQQSLALDPTLSEGYTALAELALNTQPRDVDEAIRLAQLATRVNPNNFGARRILGRLHSYQAKFIGGPFDSAAANKAIAEWKQVARLDPRNAEAWAFLSELYERTGKDDESIDALRRWIASATPVDSQFYQMLMGGQSLGPEAATLKLGEALLKNGRTREAIATASTLVVDEPANLAAVDLLSDAVEGANAADAAIAVDALRQAVYANPTSPALVNLLAQVYARIGKVDDAAALLRSTSEKLQPTDRPSAASYHLTLADVYARADRLNDAIAEYDSALAVHGLIAGNTLSSEEREFAAQVFEKMIQAQKSAGRFADARATIERSRTFLGKTDLFADRQAINLARETGSRTEALSAVQAVRRRAPDDENLIRLEATLLAENGRVDEGAALIKKLIDTPATPPVVTNPGAGSGRESVTIAVPATDAFSNYLFISQLYSQAKRGKEAIEAANQAYGVARGAARKQIARLTLATAQQMSGDFAGAETTLRGLLQETPGNPIAMNNLGYFLLQRNERFQEAFELIQNAVRIDPTNPKYLDSLGWAYFKLGKLPDAEKYLKDALRFDSSSGTVYEHLGDVYQKQGKMDLAKTSWSRAASLFSEAADVTRVKQKLVAGK